MRGGKQVPHRRQVALGRDSVGLMTASTRSEEDLVLQLHIDDWAQVSAARYL